MEEHGLESTLTVSVGPESFTQRGGAVSARGSYRSLNARALLWFNSLTMLRSKDRDREAERDTGLDDADRYHAFRSTVKNLQPSEIDRQLPNLVETVVEESEDPDTEMFVIGISFSKFETLLDYRLERLVHDEEIGRPRLETLKSAVSGTHLYLTFPYPPDSRFTSDALRGAILTTIEKQLSSRGGSDAISGTAETNESTSRIAEFLRRIGLI